MTGRYAMNVAFVLGLVLVAPLSVSELLSNPDRFHGQPVVVSGTMSDPRESISRRGTRYYTFHLSDSPKTVYVTSFVKPPCRAGATTVEGTFEQLKRRVRASYSSHGELTARTVTCVSEPPTEPAKTK